MQIFQRKRGLIVPVIADLHCGSTVAICPPAYQLADGGTYNLSAGQRELWRIWDEYRTIFDELRKNRDVYLVVLGDCTDGNHHGTTQLVTANHLSQRSMAIDLLEPIRNVADKAFMLKGTGAHVGDNGQDDDAIAKDLDFEESPTGHSWHHLLANFGGVRIDMAHHIDGMSKLPWSDLSSNRAARIMMRYVELGQKPPDLILSGHIHQHYDTYDKYSTRLITAPAWTLATAFVHRNFRDSLAHVGGMFLLIDNGKVEVKKLVYKKGGWDTWNN